MSVINSQPLIGASGQGGGYNLTKSLRFRSSASAYLNRTFGAPTNNKIWTYSVWLKRGSLAANRTIMSSNVDGAEYWDMRFNTSDQILIQNRVGSSNLLLANTTAVYRDPSAWYHIVFVFDSNNATAANRNLLYVNGVNVTLSANSGSSDASAWNVNSVQHNIGVSRTLNPSGGIWAEYDGYEAEINFVDGQALTPSSFGETSTTTGVWQPKKYTGTYGTNGFYLPFTDTTSTSTLGTDFSGNSNTWTVNNISLTSGSTYDSMNDVPTLTSATTANYCTFNPLDASTTAIASNGNLKVTNSSSANTGHSGIFCTQAFPTSGLFYYEIKIDSFATASAGGFVLNGASKDTDFSSSTNLYQYSVNSGVAYANGTTAYTGSTLTTGDILGVAVDMTNGALYFAKNNTWQNSGVPTSGASKTGAINFTVANNILPACYVWKSGGGDALSANFGQQPFSYTPPTGFVALNTFNLPTPTIGATASTLANEYMDATTYTGNGSTLSVINAGSFQPDFVWIKRRDSGAESHKLNDSVRGVNKQLMSNSTDSEYTNTDQLTSFNSNGFTTGASGTTNGNGTSLVAWQWRASNATAVTNTAGSITSTVSANTTAGFSIVTYTGNGTSGATVGHGLGVAPSMVILKQRDGASSWQVKHISLNANQNLILNSTAAVDTAPGSGYISAISSTTLTLLNGGSAITNVNGNTNTYVAYCFAPIAGYSAFGSYTGNGSTDGTFVYTGFRPRFVMVKRTDVSGDSWFTFDTSRNSTNVTNSWLAPNLTNAEGNDTFSDFLSNGFKLRSSISAFNASGSNYIYMAFAEVPYKYSLGR